MGASFINEPDARHHVLHRPAPQFTHLADSRTSPIRNITLQRLDRRRRAASAAPPSRTSSTRSTSRTAGGSTDKLTLDLGVRYDYVTGFAFDQDNNIIFSGAAGRAARRVRPAARPVPGFEDFGKEPKEDTNNIAPRAGLHLRREG